MTPRRIALCTAILLLSSAAIAQTPKFNFVPGPKEGGGEVKVTVDQGGVTEVQKDEYTIASGGVTIEYQDIKLRSDKITHNHKTGDVVAEGNVIIDQGPTRITAIQAIYNLTSKTGTFFNATGMMDPDMYFSGDRIEKVDADTYRMTNGVFSSCDLDKPAWSFRVGEAEITLDDYARFKDPSFRVRDVPVFWSPTLIWPTKRDRSRGFLIPRVNFRDRFGTGVKNGYFVPLGESADATLYGDLSSTGYHGAGVDFRYVPTQNIKLGEFRGYTVMNPDQNQLEWEYHFQHAQEELPGGFRGVVDAQDFSDLDFFRQWDDAPDVLTVSNIYSSAYLTRNRANYSLNILADRRDIELEGRRQRYQQLPSLQLRMYSQRVGGTPFYFSMESSASHLRSGAVIGGERTIDADYSRLDIFPTVSMRVRTPQWLSIKPQLSLRQTWYSASRDPETNRVNEDASVSRAYGQGQLEVVGPSFSRVFNRAAGGFSRFKHVVEPRFRYLRTTDVQDQRNIIRFDTVDTPFLPIVQDSVEYSLTQRLIGKESGERGNAREVASFSLRQSVALSDPFESAGGAAAGRHQFTPLQANLRVNPYQSLTFDASANFGNVSHQLDQLSVSTNLNGSGENADKYLGLTYYTSLERPGSSFSSSQLRVNTGSFIIRDRLRADVQLNYDIKAGEFLEHRYVAGYTGSCYGVALQYRRYKLFGSQSPSRQDEYDGGFGVVVTLKNVGTIGSF